MALLNVALPLSGLLPELYCPLRPDPFEENLKLLVTPYGSSESGIESSDSNENKNQKSSSEDDEASSTSSTSSTTPTSPIPEEKSKPASPILEKSFTNEKIEYQGRDILDLAKNLMEKNNSWKFQYARLPDNNVSMFMANRSQYHRLGANGLNREYDLASCRTCTFQYPVINSNIILNNDGANNANAKPTRLIEKAQNNMPSFKMYKHF